MMMIMMRRRLRGLAYEKPFTLLCWTPSVEYIFSGAAAAAAVVLEDLWHHRGGGMSDFSTLDLETTPPQYILNQKEHTIDVSKTPNFLLCSIERPTKNNFNLKQEKEQRLAFHWDLKAEKGAKELACLYLNRKTRPSIHSSSVPEFVFLVLQHKFFCCEQCTPFVT